jgi:hypothetical protein
LVSTRRSQEYRGSNDGFAAMAGRGFTMSSADLNRQATATGAAYRALLAVSVATVWRRDLPALFHELAGLLHQVVRFDHLTLFVHYAARSAPRAALPVRRFRSAP